MCELTVSMPAYNSEKYIREAIRSVLEQKGIDFELIVVDDGSKDNTTEAIKSFADPRIKLIRNKKNKGISYCHNLVIEQSNSPFIMHVDSDDLVLPEAFRRMVNELKRSSDIGQAHCYFFIIDEDGKMTRKSFRERRECLLKNKKPNMDYKKELLIQGSIMNGLRTYRREIFDTVGKFNEKIKYGEDYDMALRVIDKFEIKLVPEFLYCARKHKSNITCSSRFRGLVFWKQKLLIGLHLLRDNKIRFLKEKKYNVFKSLGILLGKNLVSDLQQQFYSIVNFIRKIRFAIKRILISFLSKAYNLMINRFSWWPINLFYFKRKKMARHEKKICY